MNQTPKTTHKQNRETPKDDTRPSPSLNQRSGKMNGGLGMLNRQAYIGTTIKKGPKTK